jgi:hypothetical protein
LEEKIWKKINIKNAQVFIEKNIKEKAHKNQRTTLASPSSSSSAFPPGVTTLVFLDDLAASASLSSSSSFPSGVTSLIFLLVFLADLGVVPVFFFGALTVGVLPAFSALSALSEDWSVLSDDWSGLSDDRSDDRSGLADLSTLSEDLSVFAFFLDLTDLSDLSGWADLSVLAILDFLDFDFFLGVATDAVALVNDRLELRVDGFWNG